MKSYLVTRTITMRCEVEANNKLDAIDVALDSGNWEEDNSVCRNDVLDNCDVEEV